MRNWVDVAAVCFPQAGHGAQPFKGTSQQSSEVDAMIKIVIWETKKLRRESLSNLPKAILLVRAEIKVYHLTPKLKFSIITNDIPEGSFWSAKEGPDGAVEGTWLCVDIGIPLLKKGVSILHDSRSAFYNECPFSEVSFHGVSENQSRRPPA